MTLVLRNATVLDVEAHRTLRDRSVLIEGGRITGVVEDGRATGEGPGADVVDCGGRYVLPGLVDAHVHLRPGPHAGPHSDRPPVDSGQQAGARPDDVAAQLHSYLYCGVTSVFDAGNEAGLVWPLRESERSGQLLAPRVFCAGPFVTCTGGHGSEILEAVEVDDLPADLPRLRSHLARRPDLVKVTYDEHNWGVRPLVPILSPSVLRGIVDVAHAESLRVTVHISNEMRAREAVDCGADTLAHPVIQSPITDEFAELLAVRRLPVVSTLAIGERYFRLADDPTFLDQELYQTCIGPEERRRLATEEHLAQQRNRWADWMRVMTPIAQENLRRMVAAGCIVATGTDLSLGPELVHELALLQDAGIPPWEVLTCATLNAASFLGKEQEMGSVKAGNLADLVVVDNDPSTDVSRLASLFMVVKGGRIIDRSTLELTGERPQRSDRSPLRSGVPKSEHVNTKKSHGGRKTT